MIKLAVGAHMDKYVIIFLGILQQIQTNFSIDNDDDDTATKLAIDWKRKLCLQRNTEAMSAQTGIFGLRRVSRSVSPEPSLTDF